MLEDFFAVPAAAQRLRSCVLGSHLDTFCARLVELGYKRLTIRQKLWVVSGLTRWMTKKHLGVGDLDERRVVEFVDARRRGGRTCRGFRLTVLALLQQLRSVGVVPTPEPACDDSPVAGLLARYEGYLRREPGVQECTSAGYRPFLGAVGTQRPPGHAAPPRRALPGGIRRFP